MTTDISTVLKMLVAYRKQLTAKSARRLMDFVKDTNIKAPSPLDDVARARERLNPASPLLAVHHSCECTAFKRKDRN